MCIYALKWPKPYMYIHICSCDTSGESRSGSRLGCRLGPLVRVEPTLENGSMLYEDVAAFFQAWS